jgi:hypothetical protein
MGIAFLSFGNFQLSVKLLLLLLLLVVPGVSSHFCIKQSAHSSARPVLVLSNKTRWTICWKEDDGRLCGSPHTKPTDFCSNNLHIQSWPCSSVRSEICALLLAPSAFRSDRPMPAPGSFNSSSASPIHKVLIYAIKDAVRKVDGCSILTPPLLDGLHSQISPPWVMYGAESP